MTDVERIADQLRRSVEGGAWHGPALREVLARVPAEQAAARRLPDGHSIWEIALHVGAWLSAVRRRIGGGPVELSSEEDWPPVPDPSPEAWKSALDSLDRVHRELLDAVGRLSEDDLKKTVPGRPYSVWFMLAGLIQHVGYHCGQISLLKKVPADPARATLRHTLATVAYRGGKALRGAPAGFADFRAGESSRAPAQILAHVGDLFDWALSIAKGAQAWHASAPLPWEQEVARFFAVLRAFDDYLASTAPLASPAEALFQGPVADALTHIGQIALLRRMAGSPVRGENYFEADIVAGRVGPGQTAPRREFD
jgi:uncharacterized damage-inducible protein DinB